MAKNIVEKILSAHLTDGELIPGQEIGIKIDQTLTQDATGTMAYLQFEAMKIPEIKTEVSVSYVDHNTIQVGFENFDDHLYLQSIAAKYGIIYSRAGNGICHQVHLERFGRPGKTLLGSDSHTPTCGGVGMIAMGAGGLDVAVAMGGGSFFMTAPKVYKINLTGKLNPWVSAKDFILKMLEMFTTKGNVGVIMEYGGPGIETLTVPERATITNMGAEMGVTTSVFPSDEQTRKFLKAQGREGDWAPLKADDNANYEKVVELNLSEVEPLTSTPHSPGNIKKVKDLKGIKIDQVMIGSCTNSSYVDLTRVAKILKGKHVQSTVSLGVAPGSRQVLEMIAQDGSLTDLIASGARILESTCGFCIGNSQSPGTDAISLRTSNRNFEGRSGTKSAQVYLVSPETAAAACITGEFTDPRELKLDYPDVTMPDQFLIDDTMFIFPSDELKKTEEIQRGPNIGDPPSNEKMPETLSGQVMIKVGDKITTDHIMPAGARLKFRSNVPKYATFVFEQLDEKFSANCLANKEKSVHNFIVAGESYGQGSSREHAALCPMYLSVKAIIAKSFERIHIANLINFGIAPLTFKDPTDYEKVSNGDNVKLPDIRSLIEKNENTATFVDKTNDQTFELQMNFSERQRNMLLSGGLLNTIK